MDKQSKVEGEDTFVFEMGAVSEETKGVPLWNFETHVVMPGEYITPPPV
jgi:hypothetical protein